MNDYMMDLANSHLDHEDKLEDAFNKLPRRFVFDLESLDDVNDAIAKIANDEYPTMQAALSAITETIQNADIREQYQLPNGTWEDM